MSKLFKFLQNNKKKRKLKDKKNMYVSLGLKLKKKLLILHGII